MVFAKEILHWARLNDKLQGSIAEMHNNFTIEEIFEIFATS